MNIVILGNSMIGHVIHQYFLENYNYSLKMIDRSEFDIIYCDIGKLFDIFINFRTDIVINCTGAIFDSNAERSIRINSLFPIQLSAACNKFGMKLINIGTVCYVDKNIYGLTKALGEFLLESHLTVRTSFIGPQIKDGHGLFDWMFKQDGKKINGFVSHLWSGVTTIECAKFINFAIINKLCGVINLSTGNKKGEYITKYGLLCLIKNIFNLDIEIEEYFPELVDRTFFRTENYHVPQYLDMITEMKEWIIGHPELYYNRYKIIYGENRL